MKVKFDNERKLVEYHKIAVGDMFLYNLSILGKDTGNGRIPSAIEENPTLMLKTNESGDCYEVGGNRTFSFTGSTGVYPVKNLIVEY